MAAGGRGTSAAIVGMTSLDQAISKLAGAATMAMKPIIEVGQALTGALLGPLKPIKELAGEIGHLVGLFNPAVVTRFTLAMNDTLAVMGAALVPIMESLTTYTRLWGDAMAGLLPVIQPLINAVGVFITTWGSHLSALLQAWAPLIELISDAIADFIQRLAFLTSRLTGVLVGIIEIIMALFGLESRFNKNAKSSGFAVRQVSVGSVEEFANRLFESTAKNIYGRQVGEKQDPAAILDDIRKGIQDGKVLVQDIKTYVWAILEVLKIMAKDAGDFGAGAAGGAAGPQIPGFGDFIRGIMGGLIGKPW